MNRRMLLGIGASIVAMAGLVTLLSETAVEPVMAKTEKPAAPSEWSPTKPNPSREVYYPGTEELKPDEMRVIACGSGMPMPRLKQAAACFLIELGNGDKFIFDMGTGSMEKLYALGIPLDYIDKVFLTHLHADHMGDLPAFYHLWPSEQPLRASAGLGAGRRRHASGVGDKGSDGQHAGDVGVDDRHPRRHH